MMGAFDEIAKEVDFSTGIILLDIVPSSTEIKVAEQGEETVPRSFARRHYKIVVVDRLKRLKEHYKMGRTEAENRRWEAFGDLLAPKRGRYPGSMEMSPRGVMSPGDMLRGGAAGAVGRGAAIGPGVGRVADERRY